MAQHVLIVDDDAMHRSIARDLRRRAIADVTSPAATGAPDATRAVASFDLVGADPAHGADATRTRTLPTRSTPPSQHP